MIKTMLAMSKHCEKEIIKSCNIYILVDDYELIPDNQKRHIEQRRHAIITILETNYDLLDELISKGIISQHTKQLVREENTDLERNTVLLDIILKSSKGRLNQFISCLEEQQSHVASLFKCPGKILFA